MKRILLITMLLLAGLGGFAAEVPRIISGVVYDETRTPLPGALVFVKGTKTSTITNQDGKYKITAPAGKDSLQFSFFGFETIVIKIGRSNNLDAYLKLSTQNLREVVVAGYGVKRW